jgi:pyruvate,orthophosphate dikinase
MRRVRMKVRTNAETPPTRAAREFGAEGIGLCRTEHMFFDGDRIVCGAMILAETKTWPPQKALAKLLPMQRGTSRAVRDHGWPAGDDPPARSAAARVPAARPTKRSTKLPADLGVRCGKADPARTIELHEFNPMLGHRGCRLAISYPEIAEMQARAIFEAAVEAKKDWQAPVEPGSHGPAGHGLREELDFVKAGSMASPAKAVIGENRRRHHLSRRHHDRAAARRHAGPCEIAQVAEFFSFGTNDLTQTTFGISRDDAGLPDDLPAERHHRKRSLRHARPSMALANW